MNHPRLRAALAACLLLAWSASVAGAAEAGGHEHGTMNGTWPHVLLGIYCLFVVAASLVGGWLPSLVRLTHARMQTLISFVGGLMLGIGLFHLLPHAIQELGSVDNAIYWMMGGIVTMFLLMRASHAHHHEPIELPGETHAHDHSRKAEGGRWKAEGPPTSDLVHDHDHDHDAGHRGDLHAHPFSWFGLALGLCLHTLIDGVALGANVAADAGHSETFALLGLGTFLVVLLHKPLDAIPITSVMAAGGWSAKARNAANFGFSLICPLGALLFVLGVAQFHGPTQEQIIGSALAFSAGVFLCISLGDLLPEMEFHSHDRLRLTVALLLGIALAWGITFLEPEHLHP
jgi:zinc and cadmium transporter